MLSTDRTTCSSSIHIPVLLLKTQSVPHDAYEEYFTDKPGLDPVFVPVLEHKRNESALDSLGQLLRDGKLKERYGGMIFTSQRAVEAWSDTVLRVEREIEASIDEDGGLNTSTSQTEQQHTAIDSRTGAVFGTDILTVTPFPLYVVGPATARALDTLLTTSARTTPSRSPSVLSALNPTIRGAHAGSGAVLAPHILAHYNALHQWTWLTWHDAPRLPFVPLLGMGSENYSRRRLQSDDPRLRKRPLLFLVGETRRDIIPRTLRGGEPPVEVDEVEVYSTIVKDGFRLDIEAAVAPHIHTARSETAAVVVVVIFSPQGSGDLLRALGLIDEGNRPTDRARARWATTTSVSTSPSLDNDSNTHPTYVIITIGPTTRDHLVNTFGFEPDACAKTPSPDGVGEGLFEFLRQKGLMP